jgi:hypothetical protein
MPDKKTKKEKPERQKKNHDRVLPSKLQEELSKEELIHCQPLTGRANKSLS